MDEKEKEIIQFMKLVGGVGNGLVDHEHQINVMKCVNGWLRRW